MPVKQTKAGKPNQSTLKKEVRTMLKLKRAAAINDIKTAFKDELLSAKPTRQGIASVVNVNTSSYNFPMPKMSVGYSPDGSINTKTLNSHLKPVYKEVSEAKRAAIREKIDRKLSGGGILTTAEWDRMNQLDDLLKNPFKGIF